MNGTGTAPSCGFPQATTMEEYQQQLLEWKKQYDAYMAAAAATAAGTGTTMPATQGFPMASASPVPLQEIRGGTEAETEQAMHPKKVSKQKKSVNNTLPNLNVPGVSKAMLPKSVKVDEHNSYVLQTGEKKWIDPSLADWPDDDYRLFVGDIGNDCTEELLRQAFKGYPSLQKVRVIKKRSSNKSRGYAFLSFSDPKDFLNALREMNGQYVGTRPIRLMRSKWKDRLIYDPKNPPPPTSNSKKKTKQKQ